MSRILIIITSEDKRALGERFISGKEWTNAWGFLEEKYIAFRKADTESPTQYAKEEFKGEDIELGNDNCILWIRETSFADNSVCTFIKQLCTSNHNHEVFIAHHPLKGRQCWANLKAQYHIYGLESGSKRRFQNVLITQKDGEQLNPAGSFDNVFGCFFLNPPDVLAFVEHKLKGLLAPLDIDLQLLKEKEFSEPYWSEIIKAHKSRGDIVKLARQYFYENRYSLKQLVEEENIKNSQNKGRIEELFGKIKKLLPETDDQMSEKFLAFKRILDGLSVTCLNCRDITKENTEGFRNWQRDLFGALEELRFLILEDKDLEK